jgi:hypothetical protein
MFYKALGFLVWKGAKWYARRKAPPREALIATALAFGAAAVNGARR